MLKKTGRQFQPVLTHSLSNIFASCHGQPMLIFFIVILLLVCFGIFNSDE